MSNSSEGFPLHCPVPREDHATVQMAHGGGGRVMRRLVEGFFLPAFGSDPATEPPHDAALVEALRRDYYQVELSEGGIYRLYVELSTDLSTSLERSRWLVDAVCG